MTCYHPITAWRSIDGRGANGKWPLTFKPNEGYREFEVQIPCGKCIGCRLEHSRQWAIRCVHEATLHKDNTFLTLTYNNTFVDPNYSLNKTDITNFFKRFRKNTGAKIRYFQCGEYGEEFHRPHHHVILFGYKFPDETFSKKSAAGFPLYTSKMLSDLWPLGFHEIGNVTFESAAYTARYILKKITGEAADEHYSKRIPEYVTMSRRPGIAYDWINKYYTDVYPHDYLIIRDNIICKPPKYYDQQYDQINEQYESLKSIKIKRKQEAQKSINNTPSRLNVREQIQYLKLQKLPRDYENLI